MTNNTANSELVQVLVLRVYFRRSGIHHPVEEKGNVALDIDRHKEMVITKPDVIEELNTKTRENPLTIQQLFSFAMPFISDAGEEGLTLPDNAIISGVSLTVEHRERSDVEKTTETQ